MCTAGLSRRRVLRGGALSMAALASGADKLVAGSSHARPNIVFILADDLGYADVSCYGRPDLQTPNIDRLAVRGMRFPQAYANSAVCSATRTALITGRYQDRLDIGLDEPLVSRDTGLPPSIPHCLRCCERPATEQHSWANGTLDCCQSMAL